MLITEKKLKKLSIEHVNQKLSIDKLTTYLKMCDENESGDYYLNHILMFKVLVDREKTGKVACVDSTLSELLKKIADGEDVDLEKFSFLHPDLLFIVQKSKSKRFYCLNGELIKIKSTKVFPTITERNFKFY